MQGFYSAQNTHIFIPSLNPVSENARPRHKRSCFALLLALAIRQGFAPAALPLDSVYKVLTRSLQRPNVLDDYTATC